jgi:phospholipase C
MPLRSNLENRIDHVVIIIKENHTFDNYFGTFPGAEGPTLNHAANRRPKAYGAIHRAGYPSLFRVGA